jgi:hypothetical protein
MHLVLPVPFRVVTLRSERWTLPDRMLHCAKPPCPHLRYLSIDHRSLKHIGRRHSPRLGVLCQQQRVHLAPSPDAGLQ